MLVITFTARHFEKREDNTRSQFYAASLKLPWGISIGGGFLVGCVEMGTSVVVIVFQNGGR